MKVAKIIILLAGIAGAVGVFLPFLNAGGESASFWEFARSTKETFGKDLSIQAYLALGGFALATIGAIIALIKGGLARPHAIISLLGFGVCLAAGMVREGYKSEVLPGIATGIGARVMFGAAALGALLSLISIIKPER